MSIVQRIKRIYYYAYIVYDKVAITDGTLAKEIKVCQRRWVYAQPNNHRPILACAHQKYDTPYPTGH